MFKKLRQEIADHRNTVTDLNAKLAAVPEMADRIAELTAALNKAVTVLESFKESTDYLVWSETNHRMRAGLAYEPKRTLEPR
jgi:hypothetical protein